MSISIRSAADFHKELESNLHHLSRESGEPIQRLRRKIAFDRLLARIFTQEPPSFFLKGGYAMELRISGARATKDIDLTCIKRATDTKEPIDELILQELQTLARIDLNDHFVYQIGAPQKDIENAPYGGSRHNISTIINNRLFAEFHLDVGRDFLVDQIEKVTAINRLGFLGIPTPTILMISKEQQFAEKLHSYTLPREQINTRTKDLIDLILLIGPNNPEPQNFYNSLQRIFNARNTHPLPAVLPKPPISWELPFAKMAAECGISQNLKESFIKLSDFYDSVQIIKV